MEKVFETLFKSVRDDLRKNLEANEHQRLADSSKPVDLTGQGSIPFKFHLDGNGNYHFEAQQYGGGVTVHASAWVNAPDGTYTVTVKSSDGGGGYWENVKPKQKLNCDLKTSFWHKTTITVDIHANVTNKDGDGTIEYSY
jgi:hypothetical protein